MLVPKKEWQVASALVLIHPGKNMQRSSGRIVGPGSEEYHLDEGKETSQEYCLQ